MRKAGRGPEIDGKRRIWVVLKSICVRSKGENGVAVEERVGWGECSLGEERISPQGTPPLLPLLNSFNKHLTFTERKINTQEVTSLCSQELLLAAQKHI